MREAPSLVLIHSLLSAGATVRAFDPIAIAEAQRRLGDNAAVSYGSDLYDAVVDADALVVVTEWKAFRVPSWQVVARAMRGHAVVDGRNIYDADELNAAGLDYYSIGRAPRLAGQNR